MYSVFYSRLAEKSFQGLPDKKTKLRIKKAVDSLAQNPRETGIIKLQFVPFAAYRLRVGNLRILFDIDDAKKQIFIFDIRKRNESTYR